MSKPLATPTVDTHQAPTSRTVRFRHVLTSVRPGIGLCVAGTVIAMIANHFVTAASPLLVAIALGALFANVMPLRPSTRPGLQFASKRLLRIGVALLGLQLLLSDILDLGAGVIALVVAIVVLGIVGTMFVGKLLGLSWTQRLLIACGFSICGAAAVAAVNGVVDADEEEVVTAVALVVIFGTVMIPVVPLLSGAMKLSDHDAGLWAGGSIHEVAQVVAAAGALGGAALGVATVVKLTRVLTLAPIMAVLAVRQRRIGGDTEITRPPLVPLFVTAFIAFVALRSTGVLPDGALTVTKTVQTALLTAAMFALGTGVQVSLLRKVGPRPFILAAISTVWVASIALVGVHVLR
ncbi:YeiH family protein [Rhodococcus sp. MEB064]|uniref:YeiH family protein n=1 Tax=Rhodococcus sp. MEB064 TaxID=1587522 RepID=UPI0005AD15E5|nr:putative sulfate exporter family transporter [Rhodococcus sp. MEB064]KIQ08073.1 membrane protein [Rhodococcus sp. MEB064]